MVELIFFEKFTAEFSASAPVVFKLPSPMGPKTLYTTGAGKGVKMSVAIFPSSGGGVLNRVAEKKAPFWALTTKLYVHHVLGKAQKRDPHKLFLGELHAPYIERGPQTGHFRPQAV